MERINNIGSPQHEAYPSPENGAICHQSASKAERLYALYSVLAQVPAGSVVSYGALAELAGLGRAARWVGRTLSQLPEDSSLPWHRVIAAGGRLSLPANTPGGAEQRRRLMEEGIRLCNDRIDMHQHRWRIMDNRS